MKIQFLTRKATLIAAVFTSLVSIVVHPPLYAQDRASPVSAYLRKSTALLCEIDVTKLNVDATARAATAISGNVPSEKSTAATISMGQAIVKTLIDAGANRIYVVVEPRHVADGGPLIVIPCRTPSSVNVLAQMMVKGLPSELPMIARMDDNLVMIGPESVLDRVQSGKVVKREDLVEPLSRDNRLDHSLTVSLPDETRFELGEMWPDEMPGSVPLRFSPKQLVTDARRLTLTWILPPEPNVLVTIETPNAEAAERVKQIAEDLRDLLPEAKSAINIKSDESKVVVQGAPEKLGALLAAAGEKASENVKRISVMNDLKQVLLGLHNYASAHDHLPQQCLVDKDRRPLHSWRTVLLPYLEQSALYEQMKIDEPWDSEHNRMFGNIVVPLFQGEGPMQNPFKACVRAPVFPGSIWEDADEPLKFRDVIDGTANTIAVMVAPGDASVTWTSPEKWVISEDDPMKDLFGDRDMVFVGMMDGAVLRLHRDKMTNEKLKAMLTYAGGEPIEW